MAVWAEENNIQVYRGDAHDLRKRISGCLEKFNADFFARVNADSPFIDSSLIEGGFDFLNESDHDLYTNLYPRSFPYGYSVEVFNSGSFLKVMNQNPELENVTTYFYDHASDFKIKNLKYEGSDLSKVRLTLDTKEDLEFMKELYKKDEKLFSQPLEKIIQLIQNT